MGHGLAMANVAQVNKMDNDRGRTIVRAASPRTPDRWMGKGKDKGNREKGKEKEGELGPFDVHTAGDEELLLGQPVFKRSTPLVIPPLDRSKKNVRKRGRDELAEAVDGGEDSLFPEEEEDKGGKEEEAEAMEGGEDATFFRRGRGIASSPHLRQK